MLNIKPVKLDLIDGEKPYHARPFPVPHSLETTTKTEMKSLTNIDVCNRSSDSGWEAPTFIQDKKTGGVRILTDFRRLNAQIERKPFPLPKISDMLRKLSRFKYAMAIDPSVVALWQIQIQKIANGCENKPIHIPKDYVQIIKRCPYYTSLSR
jgi:hypothetical protein